MGTSLLQIKNNKAHKYKMLVLVKSVYCGNNNKTAFNSIKMPSEPVMYFNLEGNWKPTCFSSFVEYNTTYSRILKTVAFVVGQPMLERNLYIKFYKWTEVTLASKSKFYLNLKVEQVSIYLPSLNLFQ